jgi:hypothetical protein
MAENDCALRIYDFPTFYTQEDLLLLVKDLELYEYKFKWIHDSETVLIFESKEIARNIFTRNVSSLEFKIAMVESDRIRPVKTDQVAKRMVAGALGIKVVDSECPKLEKAIRDKKKRQQDLDQAWEE